jgi:hypothetical protein
MTYSDQKIKAIQDRIAGIESEIVSHPLYKSIKTVDDLKPFAEHHVFAVWDFMSILKALQNKLTCTTWPWMPVGDAETRFLINEIVVGEESDELPDGSHISHYELYLQAMEQVGADTNKIKTLLNLLQDDWSLEEALIKAEVPEGSKKFVDFTFSIINSGKAHLMAAVFTFGREDLIPDMFRALVDDLNAQFPNQLDTFKYYLDRHIEVDGDHHSHLALQMTANLCGEDAALWAEAEEAVVQALEMRKLLWDSVLVEIESVELV